MLFKEVKTEKNMKEIIAQEFPTKSNDELSYTVVKVPGNINYDSYPEVPSASHSNPRNKGMYCFRSYVILCTVPPFKINN